MHRFLLTTAFIAVVGLTMAARSPALQPAAARTILITATIHVPTGGPASAPNPSPAAPQSDLENPQGFVAGGNGTGQGPFALHTYLSGTSLRVITELHGPAAIYRSDVALIFAGSRWSLDAGWHTRQAGSRDK